MQRVKSGSPRHGLEAVGGVMNAIDQSRGGTLSEYMAFRRVDGLTDAQVKALLDAGIRAPERLITMPLPEVRKINGLGPKAIQHIRAYRQMAGVIDEAP